MQKNIQKTIIIILTWLIIPSAHGLSFLGVRAGQKNIDIATNRIPTNRSDTTIIDITTMALTIGHNSIWNTSLYASIENPNTIFTQFIASQQLANIDIMNQLKMSKNRKKTLDEYLHKIQTSTNVIEQLKNQLTQQISLETEKYNTCQTAKLQWDWLYYQWIEQLNIYDLKNGINQSITNGKCAIEHRVRANAISSLYAKLSIYIDTLTYRYNILSTNKELIVKNFSMFQDSYLEKMMTVKNVFGWIPESTEIE
jgi:hypothetical protein